VSGGRSLTLLHIADCHLGSRPAGGAEEAAFAALIGFALRVRPDALVIAGDLFDSVRVGAAVVEWTAAQLDRLACETVVLPGNHDALLPGSPYTAHGFAERCGAATVLSDPAGAVVHVAGGQIAVWGRPVVEHAPSFQPLAGAPARPPRGAVGVIAAHGLFVDHEGEETVRGSPIYRGQIERSRWQYLALGHWPRYREVHADPPAIYAGELAHGTRHPGSAVLVTFEGGRARARQVIAGHSGEWVPASGQALES
jgi:DNA repair protein SbcD/Mre11